MMGAVRSWLLSVIAVSLLCAVADALMPSGAVKRVGRLVCGLVLIGAILSPLTALDLDGNQRWLEGYLDSLRSRKSELEETVNGQIKVIIEQNLSAYIVDKAAELGLTCRARVECGLSEDGLYLPVRTEVIGSMTADVQSKLVRIIESDLGIPPQSQIYVEEEDVP